MAPNALLTLANSIVTFRHKFRIVHRVCNLGLSTSLPSWCTG